MRTVLAESRPPGCPKSQTFCRPKLGFLGASATGRNRLEAIARSDVAEITAIADPLPELAAQAARTFPRAVVLASLDDLVEVGVEGIVIATPSALDAEQAIAALERGMAIFCSKLPGQSATEMRRVIDAARAADRLLGVDLPYRSSVQKILDLCQNGELGEIFAVDLVFHSAPEPDETSFCDWTPSGGGCVTDLGIHLLDLALWNLNFPRIANATSHVFSHGNTVRSRRDDVEDQAFAQLDLQNGATIKLACSWKLPPGCGAIISASFYGTKGEAVFHNVNGSFYEFTAARFRGSRRELLACPQVWSGSAAVDWSQRLANGEGFSNDIEYLTHVAAAIDAIHANAVGVPEILPTASNQSFSLSQPISHEVS
jgi:predicted dehydrogenase